MPITETIQDPIIDEDEEERKNQEIRDKYSEFINKLLVGAGGYREIVCDQIKDENPDIEDEDFEEEVDEELMDWSWELFSDQQQYESMVKNQEIYLQRMKDQYNNGEGLNEQEKIRYQGQIKYVQGLVDRGEVSCLPSYMGG